MKAGADYRYRLDGGEPLPDPVSRWQPDGVHGPSRVVDPAAFRWTDAHWKGLALADFVIYELHVGTFTPGGHLRRAPSARLPELAALGVTAIEIMPVARVPGRAQLGLRRRASLRAAAALRRPGGAAPARERRARARPRRGARRRLQPRRAGGELPRPLRPVLHRDVQDAVGTARSTTTDADSDEVRRFVRRQRAATG